MGKKHRDKIKIMKQQQEKSNVAPDDRDITLAVMRDTDEGDTVELDYDRLIIHEGRLMIPFRSDGYAGWRPVPIRQAAPHLIWSGGKINVNESTDYHPNGLWPEVVSFFHHCNSTRDEGQVKLYYNPQTQEWLAWAPPQTGNGMTTKTNHEDPEYNKQRETLPSGFQAWGSIHSHCNCNAFQSNVDENDEKDQNGIHITVGNLDQDEMSIHGRLYMHKLLYDMHWSDWFVAEVNTNPLESVPDYLLKLLLKVSDVKSGMAKFRGDLLEYSLKRNPGKDVEFPDLWKENFNKRKPSTVYSSNGYYGGHGGGHKFESSHMPLNEHWPDDREWERAPSGALVRSSAQRPTRIEGFTPKEGGASNGATKSEVPGANENQTLGAARKDEDLVDDITPYERDYIIDVLAMAELTSLHEGYVRNLAKEMATRDWTNAPQQAYDSRGESFIRHMTKEATERGLNTFRACFLIVNSLQDHCTLKLVDPTKDGGHTVTPFDPTRAWEEFTKTQPAAKADERYNKGD